MVIVRKGSFLQGDADITGLSRTSDLTTGLFIYGSEIPVGVSILALPDDNTITMTEKATADSASPENVEITTATVGTYLERNYALADTKFYVDERGDLAEVFLRNEDDVTRDSYNSIKKRLHTGFRKFFRTFPVIQNPSEQQLEKAGIKERTDTILYTSFKDWLDAGKNFNEIDISGRLTVIFQGETYEIKQKGLKNQMNDVYLYITLGINKK